MIGLKSLLQLRPKSLMVKQLITVTTTTGAIQKPTYQNHGIAMQQRIITTMQNLQPRCQN